MRSVVDVLRAARARIEHPGTWCKGHVAITIDGASTHAHDLKALQYCGVGAAIASLHPRDSGLAHRVYDSLHQEAKKLGFSSFGLFNDARDTKHEDVLQAYDRAIEAAEQESQCPPSG